MRHIKLIIFFVVLFGAAAWFFMRANNDASVRGQDPNVETQAVRTEGLPGEPGAATSGEPWGGDEAWIANVAALHATEMSVAELASRRAQRADVKAFAADLQRDHAAAAAAVERVAREAGVRYPAAVESRDATRAFPTAALGDRPDEEFDEAYLEAMVQSHERALAAFRHAANESAHPAVRNLAANQVSAIEAHLARARALSRP